MTMLSADEEARLVQKKLEELKKKDYLPPGLLDLVAEVYRLQIEARGKAAVTPPEMESLADDERRAQGVPLLERCEFTYDQAQAVELFRSLLALAKKAAPPLGSAAQKIETALDAGELELDKAFAAHLNEDVGMVMRWAERTPEAPRTLSFLVQSSLMPFLAALAWSLEERIKSIHSWEYGHCPACGSLPLIGSLREKEGSRMLTCSFCQTEYRTRRLGCPVCEETGSDKLAFYIVEDEPGFRVDVCNNCKCYMKIADFRKLDRKHLPLLDDLASLPLDILASQKGYSRATLSAWGF